MAYTKQDVIGQSGLPNRTIRNYIARGLLPGPRGHGLAAEYSEEHMVRAVAIGRMRAQGLHIDAIEQRIAGWSTAKFRRFVSETQPPAQEPQPPQPPPAASAIQPGASDVLAGEPVPREELRRQAPIGDGALPHAPSWRIYSLVTGIGLMVDAEAPPVVQRIAAEILAKYGPGRGER